MTNLEASNLHWEEINYRPADRFFPYAYIKETKATKEYECDATREKIEKGDIYIHVFLPSEILDGMQSKLYRFKKDVLRLADCNLDDIFDYCYCQATHRNYNDCCYSNSAVKCIKSFASSRRIKDENSIFSETYLDNDDVEGW